MPGVVQRLHSGLQLTKPVMAGGNHQLDGLHQFFHVWPPGHMSDHIVTKQ